MAVNISAWSIRHPLPPVVMAAAIIALGLHQLHQAADHAHAECRRSRHLGHDHAIRRGPGRARIAGHQEGRGRRRGRRGRPSHQLLDHRRHLEHDDHLPAGNRHRSRAQRRQGRGHARSRRSSARHRRADDPAHRHCRAADSHLCRDRARKDARAALVVRRGRGDPGAARDPRRRQRRTHRKRRARDPRRARSGSAAGRRPDPARRQPAASRQQRRPRRRAGRDRRTRPGDPHPCRSQDGRRSRRRRESRCRPAARCGWTIWASSPIRLRSRAPSPASTALPWWASASCARKAQATSPSRRRSLPGSKRSRRQTPTSSSS